MGQYRYEHIAKNICCWFDELLLRPGEIADFISSTATEKYKLLRSRLADNARDLERFLGNALLHSVMRLRHNSQPIPATLGVDLLKRHSSFTLEAFRALYSYVEMLFEESFQSTIFHWMPSGEFLNVLAEALTRFQSGALRRVRIPTKNSSVIHAKLTSYLYTPQYAEYFKSQIVQSKARLEKGEVDNLSACINDDLKVVVNILGHTVPKLLGILEDVVKLHAKWRNINAKIDYSKLRGVFEHYHLPSGLAGLEEMGVPVQTLQRLNTLMDAPHDLDVDEMAQYLRNNEDRWRGLSTVDRSFLTRTLYPSSR